MQHSETRRVGFVVKRYPRYSETFIVREILAHEQAGLAIEIFALRPPNDGHFQDLISRVRARVNYLYLPAEGMFPEPLSAATLTANHFWRALTEAGEVLPNFWGALAEARDAQARDVYQALQLAREVRGKQIDHLHAPFASDAATIARLGAHFAGVPYSFTARAKDIFHESVRPDDLRQKLRDAAGVVTVSDYHLEYLRQTYGSLAAHVQRIYNGLDLDEFPYQSPRDRPPRIVAIGRLVEKKGFPDLIAACQLLARRGCSFSCRIIGNGPLKADLHAQIDRLELQGHVELVGPRPQSEIIQEVHGAAVLAAPCIVCQDGDRDGLPNVIQEALALGTPVVSTDVTGIPEVVRHGETGLQVPQHDPPALAAAIEHLLADPELRVELATRARRFMEAEFDIHRNTARRARPLSCGIIKRCGHEHMETRKQGDKRLGLHVSLSPTLPIWSSGGRLMRVAYVCADLGVPVFGRKGCSIHVQEVVRALGEQGAQVELFARRIEGIPPPGLEAIDLHALPTIPRGDPALREQAALASNDDLRALLEHEGPFDLVYERYSLWSFAAMEYALASATPALLEVNAPLIAEQAEHRTLVDRAGAERVAERVFSAATALFAVSSEVASYLEQFPATQGRVHIVPNGVDPSRFPANLTPSCPGAAGAFTVGFVGTLKPWHGLSTLVEALALLPDRAPGLRLLIVGDGPERPHMEADVASRGLRELAQFTGAVDPDQVPSLLASMDVGVAPYPKLANFYFSPLKVYEYMAAGLPVVASSVGQLAELVHHGETGLLCPPGDAQALAEALERLRCDEVLRQRLGSAARATVFRKHTWAAVARRILDLAQWEPEASPNPKICTGN